MEILLTNPGITIPQLSKIIGITERSIERNIQKLQKERIILRIGPAKGGYWKVVKPEDDD